MNKDRANIEDLLSYSEDYLVKIQKEFDKYQNEFFEKRKPEFFCLELNGEAGELANLEKKRWKGKQINIDDLADEAADVFIALMNYCNSSNIQLGEFVSKKLSRIEKKRYELAQNNEHY